MKTVPCYVGVFLALACFMVASQVTAAQKTLIPGDSNSRISVESAVIRGKETSLLFYTWPYLGDPQSGQECAINYYSVTLRPGLPDTQASPVAMGVCSGIQSRGGLLENGDALVLARDRLERWRDGERLNSQSFSSLEATGKLGVTTADAGAQFYAISPDGSLVLAMPVNGQISENYPGSRLVITSMKPNGDLRWEKKLSDSLTMISALDLWASEGGSALLRMDTVVEGSMLADSETSLLMISGAGLEKRIKLSQAAAPFDITSIKGEQDLQKFYETRGDERSEVIESLVARATPGGGFDVLFRRESNNQERKGAFLFQLGPDGSLLSEIPLGSVLTDHGLAEWQDFYIEGNELVLLGWVLATQHGVQSKRKKYRQNLVSRISLRGGAPVSRLIPLDQRYLEAAMNAGDAELKDLPGLPGGDPVMLTRIGDTPLVVATGIIGGRFTLRLSEAGDDLLAWNKVFEENQARLAKEAARAQRRQAREASKQQINAELAAMAGMKPEELAALSNRERKEVLLKQGDPAAIQSMIAKHTQAMPSGEIAGKSAAPGGMDGQVTAALAEMQQQLADNPDIPPEMRAQMGALMAQMSQGMGGESGAPATAASPRGNPSAAGVPSGAAPEDVLRLDANLRGFVEFGNGDGLATTLLIFNRQTGAELLKKNYADGRIYEYIDFSRFGLPLEQIGVIYRGAGNQILGEPQLVVTR